jgi:hypothetical protein
MRTVFLETENARDRMAAAWRIACDILQFGKAVRLRIDEKQPTRTLDQNAKLWAMLHDIARQVEWPVDGRMQKLEAEDWKDILSAGLRKEQRVAQGLNSGFVMLGQRTSRMTIGQMSDMIELMFAFGAEHDVRWGEDYRKVA